MFTTIIKLFWNVWYLVMLTATTLAFYGSGEWQVFAFLTILSKLEAVENDRG
jgi:hypothetical protein